MSETVGEERRWLFYLTGKITLLSDGLLLSIHYQLKVLSLIRNVQNCPWHWIAQQINNLTVSCACLLFSVCFLNLEYSQELLIVMRLQVACHSLSLAIAH